MSVDLGTSPEFSVRPRDAVAEELRAITEMYRPGNFEAPPEAKLLLEQAATVGEAALIALRGGNYRRYNAPATTFNPYGAERKELRYDYENIVGLDRQGDSPRISINGNVYCAERHVRGLGGIVVPAHLTVTPEVGSLDRSVFAMNEGQRFYPGDPEGAWPFANLLGYAAAWTEYAISTTYKSRVA